MFILQKTDEESTYKYSMKFKKDLFQTEKVFFTDELKSNVINLAVTRDIKQCWKSLFLLT